MAGLTELRTAIKDTVSAALTELTPYDTVPDDINAPALIVAPAISDFTKAMQRGLDQWEFDLIVLIGLIDPQVAQNQLDAYVTGAGPKSIRQIIYNTRTLGLSNVDAHVRAMTAYGNRYDVAGVDYTGATLRLVAITTGTG